MDILTTIENAGFKIIRACTIGNIGYVIGENASKGFVTWQCKDFEGKISFYWGHYFNDLYEAKIDFKKRILVELDYYMGQADN